MTLPTDLHWLKIAEDGVPELYLDHNMMQTFRMCEANFMHTFVEGYHGKGRVWPLELGTCVHKMIEIYYLARKNKKFDVITWAAVTGPRIWHAMDMDYYGRADTKWKKAYTELGGLGGFTGLLLQYAQYFNIDNERMRVVGTELYFGKKKEVPLLTDSSLYSYAPFRLYLSGKIDLLIDDGVSIGPMDHKTRSSFGTKNPIMDYEVQEGMTGYIYAARHLTKNFPELNRQPCKKIWMNFLQIKHEKNVGDRFRRQPLIRTDEQLEQYRMRQISTAARIFQLLSNPEMQPFFNGMACTNWMHNTCGFLEVHRQGSTESQLKILSTDFLKGDIWNPETVDTEESNLNKIVEEEVANVS